MCGPVAFAATAAAASIGSAVIGASAQRKAAKAQASQQIYNANQQVKVANYNATSVENVSNYNAGLLDLNAAIYDAAATDSIQRGTDAAYDQRKEFAAANATGRAITASSGTRIGTGTNLDLQVQNAQVGEMNALTVMNNAEREAYGYKVQAVNYQAQATGERYTGKVNAGNIRESAKVGFAAAQYGAANTRYAGSLASQSTLITGFSNAASGLGKSLFTRG